MINENLDGKIHVLDDDFAYISLEIKDGESFTSDNYEHVFLKKYARYLLDNCKKEFLMDILMHMVSDRFETIKKTFEDSFKLIMKNPDPSNPLDNVATVSFKFKRFEDDNL